jgi:hypothetical protein
VEVGGWLLGYWSDGGNARDPGDTATGGAASADAMDLDDGVGGGVGSGGGSRGAAQQAGGEGACCHAASAPRAHHHRRRAPRSHGQVRS